MAHFIPRWPAMRSLLRRRLATRTEASAPDPIDHPALRHLSPRELADLPFPRPGPRQ